MCQAVFGESGKSRGSPCRVYSLELETDKKEGLKIHTLVVAPSQEGVETRRIVEVLQVETLPSSLKE